MKKLFALTLVLSMFFVMGCSEETKKVDEFDVLSTYLEGTDGGYINNMGSWILNSGNVGQLDTRIDFADYTVLDLREATGISSFAEMHIPGAINVTLSNMFTAAEASTKPILVTCYSGQTASFAHTLLRLKGYEAYVMKFGMSSYDASLDKWTNNCKDQYAGDLVKTASPTLPSYDFPKLDTGKDKAEDILDVQIDKAVAAWGTTLIGAGTVIASTDDYNIVNYWSETDYLGLGHINGAYQVTPNTLTKAENLSVFDPAGGNVLYCYTGQTAAATCAFLDVVGYEVKDIKFGFNNMNWLAMPGHKWPKPYATN